MTGVQTCALPICSPAGLPNNSIYSLAANDYGEIWIGTLAGLAKFNGQTWTNYYTYNSGLDDEWIQSLLIDARGNVWIGTNGGGLTIYNDESVDLEPVVTFANDLKIPDNNFSLKQNYPNPFQSITTIGYTVPERSRVNITVYDSFGRKVKTLVNSEQPVGNHTVNFNAYGLSDGIYFYRINVGITTQTKKMILQH